jgi:hypothetical protein
MHTIFAITGMILTTIGLLISVLFWIPGICNRERLKEMLGSRYPVVYVVYIANGPLLLVLGLILAWKFH